MFAKRELGNPRLRVDLVAIVVRSLTKDLGFHLTRVNPKELPDLWVNFL